MHYVRRAPPTRTSQREGWSLETRLHYVWATNMLNIYESQYAYTYVRQSTNTLPVRYVAVKYLWLCILLAYRLRRMQLMNHEYILAVSSVIAVQMKSRNPLWNPEICFKSRNPSLWNPEIRFEIQKFAWNPEIPWEIHFEIQKSALKSRNPLWNPEIQFEIRKSTLKSRNPFWNPKSTLKSRNPFWNPKSTWNPVDFEISYAETRRGGPLDYCQVLIVALLSSTDCSTTVKYWL